MNRLLSKNILTCLLLTALLLKGSAQESVHKKTNPELYKEIAVMDSLLFTAFNARDLEKLKTFFTADLEVFQDNTGVRNYFQTIEAFKGLFAMDYVLTRKIVNSSMDVYPIKDFGAIESGAHNFCHTEQGKLECATFKFMHVWEKTPEGWKIKRLITYDH